MSPWVFVVLAQGAFATGGGGFANAWASARPPECAALDTGRASNVWERAKAPELRKYCDLVAAGASKLAGSTSVAREVIAMAQEAERIFPANAAPLVLKGRALAQLGEYPAAFDALSEAKHRDDRALDDPHALFAWARVLARTNRMPEAAAAYLTLLPRASTLTLADRAAASIEAGMVIMAPGAPGIDDAVAIFREALRDSQDVAQSVAVVSLALALDRAGDRDESRSLLRERAVGDPRATLATTRAADLLGVAGGAEVHALAAIALEGIDPAAARTEWGRYLGILDAPADPHARARAPSAPAWADHARAHVAALSGKSRKGAPSGSRGANGNDATPSGKPPP